MGRRELLRVLGATTGVITAPLVLPRSWSTPLLQLAPLPAHGSTSTVMSDSTQEISDATITVTQQTDGSVKIDWTGLGNGPFEVLRDEAGDIQRPCIVDATVSSCTDKPPVGSYTYSVRTSNGQSKTPTKRITVTAPTGGTQ